MQNLEKEVDRKAYVKLLEKGRVFKIRRGDQQQYKTSLPGIGEKQNNQKETKKDSLQLNAIEILQEEEQLRLAKLEQNVLEEIRNFTLIGNNYKNKHDYHQAAIYYEKSLKLRKQFLGLDHTANSNILYSLGCMYYNLKDLGKARSMFYQAYKQLVQIYPSSHVLVKQTKEYLKILEVGIPEKEVQEQKKVFQQEKESRTLSQIEENKKQQIENLEKEAKNLMKEKNYRAAIEKFLQSKQIRMLTIGLNKYENAELFEFLGFCYCQIKDYENSRKFYYDAQVQYQSHGGPSNPKAKEQIQNIKNLEVAQVRRQFDIDKQKKQQKEIDQVTDHKFNLITWQTKEFHQVKKK